MYEPRLVGGGGGDVMIYRDLRLNINVALQVHFYYISFITNLEKYICRNMYL